VTAQIFSPTSPSGRVLRYVQRHGECSVKELAEGLGVSATAVREPLAALKAEGLVHERVVRRGAGRPLALYSLTTKAQSTFAREYDVLVTLLLREVMAQVGNDRTEEILTHVSARLAQHYGGRTPGTSLGERLTTLRATLEQKGIPADVASGELHLFACPYYDVAQEHPAVCAMEQRMLEQLLDHKLVLEQSIRDGHHCCRFAVEP
jgi:DeoR family transcriptional regulator, suf operon transcriptional repressor